MTVNSKFLSAKAISVTNGLFFLVLQSLIAKIFDGNTLKMKAAGPRQLIKCGIIHSVRTQSFPKTVRTRTCAYQVVKNVSFSENLNE